MTEHIVTCRYCHSPDVRRIHKLYNRNVYQCNMCVYTWTDYQPWRSLPITEQQAQWLKIRGLTCDGTRGNAADMIGDRLDWRGKTPTDAQREWFADRELPIPATSGEAAKTMYFAYWDVEEPSLRILYDK